MQPGSELTDPSPMPLPRADVADASVALPAENHPLPHPVSEATSIPENADPAATLTDTTLPGETTPPTPEPTSDASPQPEATDAATPDEPTPAAPTPDQPADQASAGDHPASNDALPAEPAPVAADPEQLAADEPVTRPADQPDPAADAPEASPAANATAPDAATTNATDATATDATATDATTPGALTPDPTQVTTADATGELLAPDEEEDDHEEPAESGEDAFAALTMPDLVATLEGLLKEESWKKVEATLRLAKARFDTLRDEARFNALQTFIAEGGEAKDFDYRPSELATQFETLYRQLRDKRTKQLRDLEKNKERNLTTKQALLERLRHLVDAEETQNSITAVKEIQREWKATGAVAPQLSNELWASYHGLIERHYANRSIYYELKELDRKKNLELKLDVCDRIEKLAAKPPSSAVTKELKELQEEFKHIGPAPKDEQEALWQRFKTAADILYGRRREQMDGARRDMDENLRHKNELLEQLKPFTTFEGQKIGEWNEQTQALLELQKLWNATGPAPRDKAKEVSKQFWHDFKAFFHRKNEFFRKLEEYRANNLKQKTELCEKVEALLTADDLGRAAEEVKQLQAEWKAIGPVPEKVKNQIFERFKVAADGFFNRRREGRAAPAANDREFEENMAKKVAICESIEALSAAHESDVRKLNELKDLYAGIGYVPRKDMYPLQERYQAAVKAFAQNADQLPAAEKEKITRSADAPAPRSNPTGEGRGGYQGDRRSGSGQSGERRSGGYQGERRGSYQDEGRYNTATAPVPAREQGLRRRITQLENDIALLRNNIEFFARSKNADQLRADTNEKIAAAEVELAEAKAQLRAL